MQLTMFSDYALRILIYLAAPPKDREEKLPSLLDISRAYGISFNHLSKVAHRLSQLGYVQAQRGRSGAQRPTETRRSMGERAGPSLRNKSRCQACQAGATPVSRRCRAGAAPVLRRCCAGAAPVPR